MWFEAGGLFTSYRRTGVMQVRKKCNEGENKAKFMYDNRSYQTDQIGAAGESRPLYIRIFSNTFVETCDTSLNISRQAREWNTRVNRSLVGKLPAFSSANDHFLLNTVAPGDRVRGSGDIGGEVVVSEMSTSSSARSTSNRDMLSYNSPSRSLAANDRRWRRPRRMDVEFGMSPNAVCLPSTGQCGTINVTVESLKYVLNK